MVFGGMITIMLLGFAIDQIPDPNFAILEDVDPQSRAEKGKGKGKGKSDKA
jgi:hypothetical protein